MTDAVVQKAIDHTVEGTFGWYLWQKDHKNLKSFYAMSKIQVETLASKKLPSLTKADKKEAVLRRIRDIAFAAACMLLFLVLIVFGVMYFHPFLVVIPMINTFLLGGFFTGAGLLAVGGLFSIAHYCGEIKKKSSPYKEAYRVKVGKLFKAVEIYNKVMKSISADMGNFDQLAKNFRKAHSDVTITDKKLRKLLIPSWKKKLQKFYFGKEEERRALSMKAEAEFVKKSLYHKPNSEIARFEKNRKFFEVKDD